MGRGQGVLRASSHRGNANDDQRKSRPAPGDARRVPGEEITLKRIYPTPCQTGRSERLQGKSSTIMTGMLIFQFPRFKIFGPVVPIKPQRANIPAFWLERRRPDCSSRPDAGEASLWGERAGPRFGDEPTHRDPAAPCAARALGEPRGLRAARDLGGLPPRAGRSDGQAGLGAEGAGCERPREKQVGWAWALPAHFLPGHTGVPRLGTWGGAGASGQRDRQDVPTHVTFDSSINLGSTPVTDFPSPSARLQPRAPAIFQALTSRQCQAADAVAGGPSGRHGAASSHPADCLSIRFEILTPQCFSHTNPAPGHTYPHTCAHGRRDAIFKHISSGRVGRRWSPDFPVLILEARARPARHHCPGGRSIRSGAHPACPRAGSPGRAQPARRPPSRLLTPRAGEGLSEAWGRRRATEGQEAPEGRQHPALSLPPTVLAAGGVSADLAAPERALRQPGPLWGEGQRGSRGAGKQAPPVGTPSLHRPPASRAAQRGQGSEHRRGPASLSEAALGEDSDLVSGPTLS